MNQDRLSVQLFQTYTGLLLVILCLFVIPPVLVHEAVSRILDRFRKKRIVTEYEGHPLVWNGHLCEGYKGNFMTRCGKHDVDQSSVYTGPWVTMDLRCPECLEISRAAGVVGAHVNEAG